MRKNFLILSKISMLFVFTSLFSFSLFALLGLRISISALYQTWLWPAYLLINLIGLLILFYTLL